MFLLLRTIIDGPSRNTSLQLRFGQHVQKILQGVEPPQWTSDSVLVDTADEASAIVSRHVDTASATWVTQRIFLTYLADTLPDGVLELDTQTWRFGAFIGTFEAS